MDRRPLRVTKDTGDLAGWTAGRGTPVLLLHGGPGLPMDYLDGLVDELVHGFHVAVFQQRGLTPSTEEGPFTVARAVDDVVLVLDHLGWDRALLLGHSWGGHLALHVAVAAPARVAGVLALDPLGAADDGGNAEFTERLLVRAAPGDLPRIEELMAVPDESATEAEHLELLDLLWPGYFSGRELAPPMPRTRVGVAAAAGLWQDLTERMPALAEALPAVDVPMTLVGCGGSPIPVEAVRRTAELLPDAELEVLEGVGHFPWMEQPGLVAPVLAGLARRCGGRAGL